MAIFIGGTTTDKLPVDYEFEFFIKYGDAVEKDVLTNSFTHNEDCWQLELERVEGNNDSQSGFNCKLRLVCSTSKWKVTRISLATYADNGHVKQERMDRSAILFNSGVEQYVGYVFYGYKQNDTAKIIVEVLKHTEAIPNPKRIIQPVSSTLSSDVLKWFEAEDFGDATIVAADGKKLRCHRDVVARRCEVLDLMFSYAMKDSGQNVINIKNFNREIIAHLLLFIYTNECGNIGPIADHLYVAADEYQLDCLKHLCQSALAHNLSQENVVETQQLADHYHLEKLKAKCADYLANCEGEKSEKSTASMAAEGPKAKRPRRSARLAKPIGLSITSNIVDKKTNDTEYWTFPLYCQFEFVVSKVSRLGEVVFSHKFTHNGNVWQLEVERSGVRDVRCQLHLVETSSERLKMACVVHIVSTKYYDLPDMGYSWYDSDYEDYDDIPEPQSDVTETTPVALFQHSGDTHDFGTLKIGSNDGNAKLKVQLVSFKSVITSTEPEPPNPQLVDEVLKWFDSEDFGDLTIVAADGHKFRCHRDILTRRSEVFNQKFNADVSEAQANVVNKEADGSWKSQASAGVLEYIKNFDGGVIAQLLLFIYTDECGEIGPIADRLWFAAHQYRLDRLKNLCETAMAINLSAKSVVKTYRLANCYRLDGLMAVCVDYLHTHKAVLSAGDLLAGSVEIQDGNGS